MENLFPSHFDEFREERCRCKASEVATYAALDTDWCAGDKSKLTRKWYRRVQEPAPRLRLVDSNTPRFCCELLGNQREIT